MSSSVYLELFNLGKFLMNYLVEYFSSIVEAACHTSVTRSLLIFKDRLLSVGLTEPASGLAE